MWGPREVFNELKWRHGALGDARVYYRHRGAPGDVADAAGRDVVELGRSFFELRGRGRHSTSIPYHRVLRIERAGEPVWERRVVSNASGAAVEAAAPGMRDDSDADMR